jgi:hypothetical protein
MELAFLAYRLALTVGCTGVAPLDDGGAGRAVRIDSIHQDAALSALCFGLLVGGLLLGARLLKREFIRCWIKECGSPLEYSAASSRCANFDFN